MLSSFTVELLGEQQSYISVGSEATPDASPSVRLLSFTVSSTWEGLAKFSISSYDCSTTYFAQESRNKIHSAHIT